MYRELIADEQRNRRICDDVVKCVRDGRSPLVITERSEHLDRLEQLLVVSVPHLVVLRAGLGRSNSKQLRSGLLLSLAMKPACCWPPAGTSERDSTIRAWTPCC